MKKLALFIFLSQLHLSYAQEIDKDVLEIKNRLEAIASFTADLSLDIDVEFINMPTKTAQIEHKKGSPVLISSEDFLLIPKRGLDISFQELFMYSFITINRGFENYKGATGKLVSVIPTDKRADYAIATLLIDTVNKRILRSEINTNTDGSYSLTLNYSKDKDLLPSYIEIDFEMEKIKLPINFMGEDTKIDRRKMKDNNVKTGKIFLSLSNYKVQRL